jgi:hypothetical protein
VPSGPWNRKFGFILYASEAKSQNKGVSAQRFRKVAGSELAGL